MSKKKRSATILETTPVIYKQASEDQQYVDLEWLSRCHGCSGAKGTYKYLQFFSGNYKEKDKDEDEENTRGVCKDCSRKAEEGNVNWSHQDVNAYQQ